MDLTRIFAHYSHPSVYFPIANIIAFAQSGSMPAVSVAFVTAAGSIGLRTLELFPRAQQKYQDLLASSALPETVRALTTPLGSVALGTATAAVLSLGAGALLPAAAGLCFALGNYCNSDRRLTDMQYNEDRPVAKTLSNAAVWYGIGYTCLGIMAGGFHSTGAALATSLGITVLAVSTIGILTKKLTSPAAPFIAVAAGTAVNALAGVISGNIPGAINNLLAMMGELSLAYAFEKESQKRNPHMSAPNESGLNRVLSLPARLMLRSF